MAKNWDEEIKRKALAGIALTNPTAEAQAKYDSYKKGVGTQGTSEYANTTQGRTGQVQYPTLGTITNAPTPSNIQLTDSMVDEIKSKSANGIPLTNWSAQKQELYNTYKNPAPTYQKYSGGDAPTYSSQYESLISSALNDLLGNTGNFSYDYKNDPLYSQYKESYQREGDRALTNSMAEATALTGGRMNSNAMIAGQQAQNYYNAQLNDKIPELEQYAYQKHLADLQQQQSNIGTLQNLESQDYGKYQDQLSQFNTDRSFDYNAVMDENSYNYQNFRDTQNYDRSVIESDRGYDYNLWNTQNALAQDQRNFGYQKERDTVGDTQWQKTFEQSVNEFAQQMAYNKERAAAGDTQWEKQFNRGNYEFDTSRDDNLYMYNTDRTDKLSQQSIENALNEYQLKNSSKGSSSGNSDYDFKDYSSRLNAMLSAKDISGELPKYSQDQVKDQVIAWFESGAITREQANKLFNMYGLK